MGELVLQVRGDEQVSQRSSSKWKQQDLEDKRCQGKRRRVLRPGQRADNCESGSDSAVIVGQTAAKSSTDPDRSFAKSGGMGRR